MENEPAERNPGITVKPEMKNKIMSDGEVEQIHQATLTVLQEAGVKFPSQKALNIFADAGADVDHTTQIVKISPDLLSAALAKAPQSYVMASRGDESLDLYLDGTKTYCGAGGTGNSMFDVTTSKIRNSTKKDVATTALVSDYLSEINFYWPVVSATDKPPASMPLHEIEASFNNTQKHVHIVTCVAERTAQYAVEMATVVAGGSREARNRPPLSLLVSPISPLGQESGAIEAALVFAEAGLPVGFGTMPSIGSTGPASIAVTRVSGNAEILSAACLIQLASPGAPLYYPFFSMTINPFSGAPVTSWPLGFLFDSAVAQLGHYYHLPTMSAFFGLDTKDIWSWQAGVESCIGGIQFFAGGADLAIGFGLLDSANAACHEKLIMDADILNSIRRIVEGFRVDVESLAVDDILAIGPMGHFLETSRTLKNMRELWQPGICQQWSPADNTFSDPKQVVDEKVQWILGNHVPNPLDTKVQTELGKITESAERELVN
jgi:trimethylamine--corrinoid protein Co-methyltransferase